MWQHSIIVLLYALFQIAEAQQEYWYFGKDSKDLSVIDEKSGSIGYYTINTWVYVTAPECMEINYVQVRVYDRIAKPYEVSYNKHTQYVCISFSKFKSSKSRYSIIAKGKRRPLCVEKKKQMKMRGKWRGW